jgi:hypothetical protein
MIDWTLKVGDKIGFYFVGDVYPCTVSEVKNNGKTVVVRRNDIGPNKLVWPEQDFPILETTSEGTRTFTLRKNGRYVAKGTEMWGRPALTAAHKYYQDPHF